MKYYIIAGEASGDLHASNLMKAIKLEDPQANFRVWGGDLMEEAGGHLVKHYRDLAFMGFLEVVKNLRTILGNIKFCKTDILTWQPDVLILVDYPGFNLRIAKWAKKVGIKVFYYISPQIWAWHSSRVHGIKASVDRMFVILPFESDFYEKYAYHVDFVGHPLLDVAETKPKDPDFLTQNGLSPKPIIALLPGSRKQEISRMLPTMCSLQSQFPGYQFVLAGAPGIDEKFYTSTLSGLDQAATVKIVRGQTYALLQHATAALVTSGTATLETALFEVPQVVCYSGNWLSYFIARRLVNVKYISLVNLVLDRPLVTELIQEDFNTKRLKVSLQEVLSTEGAAQLKAGYQELKQLLGQSGASTRAAKLMVGYLKDS
ncbi:MAG: lipid-A-disaccharide synthase [Saprospiraceae bacterium]|nr:MAG: lipid-A-disaccharide synthase [Saprospiraceae bacterium]